MSSAAASEIPIELPRRTPLSGLDEAALRAMLAAGEEARASFDGLREAGSHVVAELLRDADAFYQWQHYPPADVYDGTSHSQYYYHAHPKEERPDEHGHFHTFLRAAGMPQGCEPVGHDEAACWPAGDNALSHLVAIAIDDAGEPTTLFTVNRWVTGDTWYRAEDVCAMVERFAIRHDEPCGAVNRWLTAMIGLFRPLIQDLIRHRDVVVEAWRAGHGGDVYEDKALEVTSQATISVSGEISRVRALIG